MKPEQTLEVGSPKYRLLLNRVIADQAVENFRRSFADKIAAGLHGDAHFPVDANSDSIGQRHGGPAIIQGIIMISQIRSVRIPLGLRCERGGNGEVVGQVKWWVSRPFLQVRRQSRIDVGGTCVSIDAILGQVMVARTNRLKDRRHVIREDITAYAGK